MAINACIFDMDGTLVDNWRFHNRAWTALLAEFDVHLTLEGFFAATGGGMTNVEILRKFIGEHLTDDEIAALGQRKETHYRELYAEHRAALPGLADFLDRLRADGVRTALATSAGRDNVAFILDGIGLADRFDLCVAAEDVMRGKPDPEVFHLAAQRLHAAPENCLVFEDSPSGIEAARRANMSVVAITTSLTHDNARALGPHVRHAAPHYEQMTLDDCLQTSSREAT